MINMFNRLYLKLAASLLVLFVLVGSALFWVITTAVEDYQQEVSQRLNESVAMYVTDELELIDDGKANVDALKTLAHHAMIINPAIEVFLLDPQGNVISHALDDQEIRKRTIDLNPVENFLRGDIPLPLYGENPRHPENPKVFSASPVIQNDKLQGYVYIILEGQAHEQVTDAVIESSVLRMSVIAIAGCLTFGLITALFIFIRLSRRLHTLTHKADEFFRQEPSTVNDYQSLDELDRLNLAFDTMAQRIQYQVGQIKQADNMRRELISNISHDLRTPLTSMQGYIETALLKFPDLDEAQLKEYLSITHNHSKQLGRLVADLFELTKLDNNSVTPNFEVFSLAELVQDILQGFQLKADEKQIALKLVGDLDNSGVEADIRLMERVMNNLIDNALRYTPAGGNITVTLTHVDQSIEVKVSDTGSGIGETDLPHIFDRHYHARSNSENEQKSTGLGLAIVKRILELHLSRIRVSSIEQQGTIFSFVIPQQHA